MLPSRGTLKAPLERMSLQRATSKQHFVDVRGACNPAERGRGKLAQRSGACIDACRGVLARVNPEVGRSEAVIKGAPVDRDGGDFDVRPD